MRKIARCLTPLVVTAVLLAACGGSRGEKILEKNCTSCHEKADILEPGRTREGWTLVVNQMIVYGAELDEENKQVLIDHLAENYGPE